MANSVSGDREIWAKRSVIWLRVAPEAASPDDAHNQVLMDAAAIQPGHRVLDLGSGTGEPAISVALRVGPAGSVIATDFSPDMLTGARRRAAALELRNVRFAVSDMARLPFADRSFDAATCRFGLMFPSDRVTVAKEARRFLKPGARVAYMVWGPLEDNALHAVLGDALRVYFGDPAAAGPPRRHALGEVGALAAVLEAAGFVDVEELEHKQVREVSGGRAFWRGRIERNHFDRYRQLGETERESLEDAVQDAFASFRDGAVYRLPQHVRVGIGTAPS